MFWNKKELAELKTLDIVVKANSDQSNINFKHFNEKLDLILDHLKLKYVPETETKEPAKLVEKTVVKTFFDNLENGAIVRIPDARIIFGVSSTGHTGNTVSPKKKGRPKKK